MFVGENTYLDGEINVGSSVRLTAAHHTLEIIVDRYTPIQAYGFRGSLDVASGFVTVERHCSFHRDIRCVILH